MEKPLVKKVPDDFKSPSLRRWHVYEITLPKGERSRHIVGHDVSNNTVRVSSIIKSFDQKTMTVTTSSNRQYILLGVPGWGRKLEHMWRDWCRINKVVTETDVTSEYFDADNFFHHDADDDDDD